MRFASRLGALAACWALSVAAPALAQPVDDATRSAARKLGYSGVEAYQKGDYATASDKLEKAYRALRVPSLGLWSARALLKLSKLVEASERYLEVTGLSVAGGDEAVQRQAQTEAQSELDALTPKIPSVIVQLEGATAAEVQVTIDGLPLSSALVGEARPVNPGRHKIEGLRGGDRAAAEVSVAEGEQLPVVLRFAAQASPQPAAPVEATPAGRARVAEDPGVPAGSGRRTAGWIAIGLGGAGLVLGGVTGAMALGRYGEFEDNPNCSNDTCLPSERSAVDGYQSLRRISTIGFIAGGALTAAGAVLLLTAPSSTPPRAALWLGPSSAGFTGKF